MRKIALSDQERECLATLPDPKNVRRAPNNKSFLEYSVTVYRSLVALGYITADGLDDDTKPYLFVSLTLKGARIRNTILRQEVKHLKV